ncbi:MAG: Tol-Pal system protein TolB [Sulfurospirillaceae bacterium]|nr:Tol-Pal system protein TolB [Sulfurospirillaceae bacterium]
MFKKILSVLLFVSTLFAADATVEVVKKMDSLPKIAIQDATAQDVDKDLRIKFFKILVGDLKVSSHFRVVEDYLQSSYEGGPVENFLSDKKPDLILRFKLSKSLEAVFANIKLINAKTGETNSEKSYKIADGSRYPFLAHKISVDVNAHIGAPSIAWMEQFVIFAKYTQSKQSEIVLSDYTLSFQKTIVKGGLNIFPKWANKIQDSFYYTSYAGKDPSIYKVELKNGSRTKIVSGSGMLVCSDVSRDGKKLLLTMAPKDQADIYLYDLATKRADKITDYSGIDVSGSFVDNDKRIVFVSDRLGYPNIFAQNINSKNVEQMVYHGKNNNSCSAFDNYIVYSSREDKSEFGGGTFNLYLISTQTDYIRQLTSTGQNLFPRFATDPDTIMFIKNYKNESALGVIRLNANKTYHFPLKTGKIQSIDW